jgi:hypothetical protein
MLEGRLMSLSLQPITGMKSFLGISLWQLQLVLLAVGLAFTGIY